MIHLPDWWAQQAKCSRWNPQGFGLCLSFCSVIWDFFSAYLLQSHRMGTAIPGGTSRNINVLPEGWPLGLFLWYQADCPVSCTGQTCPARGTGLPLISQICPWLGTGHFLWIKEDGEWMENHFGFEHFMVPCAGLPLRAGKKCPPDPEIGCTRLFFASSVPC